MRGFGRRLGQSLLLVVGSAVLWTSSVGAQPAAHKPSTASTLASPLRANPSWSELSPAQRTALAPLERDWPTIDADRKEKWLEVAAKFHKMSPEERQRIQARMTEWARLSPKERGEARLHYQELRQMNPAERQARWEQYQALPPDQRRRLAERAGPASAPERSTSRPRAAAAASAPVPKSNIVSAMPPPTGAVRPVAPTVVQAKPGATTTLMSKPAAPPVHQQPGLPKVAATPGFVDRTTLLPQKGAQAAGTRSASAASAPPARP